MPSIRKYKFPNFSLDNFWRDFDVFFNIHAYLKIYCSAAFSDNLK